MILWYNLLLYGWFINVLYKIVGMLYLSLFKWSVIIGSNFSMCLISIYSVYVLYFNILYIFLKGIFLCYRCRFDVWYFFDKY